jgi:phosphoribosyl 1,2-cyclic phosphodiesterase
VFRLKALASSSSGNAFLVQSDQVTFLIEAGLPMPKLLKILASERVDPQQLAAAFVSHEHRDHIQAAEALARSYGVPIVANERVLKASGLLRLAAAHTLEVGTSLRLCNIDIWTFPIPHDSVAPVGFCLRCESQTICITTDLGDDCPQLGEHIADADLIVLEANHDQQMLLNSRYPYHLRQRILSDVGHLSNRQTAAILLRHLRRDCVDVWLAHLSQNNNTPALAHRTVSSLLREAGLGAVRIAVVGRLQPSLEWPPPPRPQQLSLFDIAGLAL